MAHRRWTEDHRAEIRRLVKSGMAYRDVAQTMNCSWSFVGMVIAESGGVCRERPTPTDRLMCLADREEISRGLVAGRSLAEIARVLGRSPSTLSREVAANGGRRAYRAWAAQRRAQEGRRRPKRPTLVARPELRKLVEAWLEERWSPQQIARRLHTEFPTDPTMWVSHETIYQSLYVQGRGALRRELATCLRSGRARRRPQSRQVERRGQLRDMVLISERPPEIEDRAVPGHWEGDLIIGKAGRSAIATLVERSTRYVMLARVTDQTAATVREAITGQILRLPAHLRRSLTWDQGKEMAEHRRFSVDTDVEVFFCDPHSPWQRGSNENTNGLLRQYFPKGTDLSGFTQDELDRVAHQLNGRPRMTLDWMKPCEKFAELVATTG